jgi:hypothetical protein
MEHPTMDDDLRQTNSMTQGRVGAMPDDLLEDEGLSAEPASRSSNRPWSERIRRGARIAAFGKHRGVMYHWRDRLTIIGRALVVAVGMLAFAALVLDVGGVDRGPLNEAEVATREAILALYGHTAEFGMMLLNNPLITLAVVLLVGGFLWREEM